MVIPIPVPAAATLAAARRQMRAPLARYLHRHDAGATHSSLWANVRMEPPDAVFGVTDAWARDTRAEKINLGVGAYRDDEGKPYVLPCVREAERRVLSDPATSNKEYLLIDGMPAFRSAAADLAYGGPKATVICERRVAISQTLSGTGALALGAGLIKRHLKASDGSSPIVATPAPTWGNHHAIMKLAGLRTVPYTWLATAKKDNTNGAAGSRATAPRLDVDAAARDIRALPPGSVVLLHACAHNPTGIDPTPAEWQVLLRAVADSQHLAFFDMAYQGFATGDTDADAAALRAFVDAGIPVVLAQSFAKNMGLYGERVGAFSVVTQNEDECARVQSHLKTLARAAYSNPPAHGARIASRILNDVDLKQQWLVEVKGMADRISGMRSRLRSELEHELGSQLSWAHITEQIGMFCYTGLTPAQVARLATDFGIYMTADGRISIAGINSKNVGYLAKSIHEVTKVKI